jgi:uncharacterized RDD family membrane protein YckC
MQDLSYAVGWKRIGAFIIDFIILYAATPVVTAIICLIVKIPIPPTGVISLNWHIVMGVIFLINSWLYFAFSESSKKQASIGKRILKILVADFDGNQINFYKASLRFWGKLFISPSLFFTGLIIKKRAWHDLFAKTLVINKAIALTVNNYSDTNNRLLKNEGN